jgi:hypothetical protein
MDTNEPQVALKKVAMNCSTGELIDQKEIMDTKARDRDWSLDWKILSSGGAIPGH